MFEQRRNFNNIDAFSPKAHSMMLMMMLQCCSLCSTVTVFKFNLSVSLYC